MFAYVTLGTNDLARASAFYDALLQPLGIRRVREFERLILWGTKPGLPMLAVCRPWDRQTATGGNGTMVALEVDGRGVVDRLHRLALELGAMDEGAPGVRTPGFYIGYFRDLDGNKLNFCHIEDS